MKKLFFLLTTTLLLISHSSSFNIPATSKGFEPNYGQIARFEGERVTDILFSTKESGYSLYFKAGGVSYVIYLREPSGIAAGINNPIKNSRHKMPENIKMHYARIDLELVNANIDRKKIIYEAELPGYSNYYLAHCLEGILNVKSYNKVRIKEVYPGIDWVFRYDEKGELHHEFEVNPGADVNQIKFRVKYADVSFSPDGKR